VVAAGDPDRWDRLRRIAAEHALPFALGVHPWWPDSDALERLADELSGACALGETGLDFHRARDEADRDAQRRVFEPQLELAARLDLPVVLHAVKAVDEVVKTFEGRGLQGQLHAFVRGDPDRALAAGLHLSFGPDLLRSHRARDAMARVPHDRLLLETDAPHRAHQADRGEPAHIVALAECVARSWDATVHDVLATTGANARRLFRLESP
jgi:TatD DNase family protein